LKKLDLWWHRKAQEVNKHQSDSVANMLREGLAIGLYKVAKADKEEREEQIKVALDRAAAAASFAARSKQHTTVKAECASEFSTAVKAEPDLVKEDPGVEETLEGGWDYSADGDGGALSWS
jgi:RecB family endonuclease NucS